MIDWSLAKTTGKQTKIPNCLWAPCKVPKQLRAYSICFLQGAQRHVAISVSFILTGLVGHTIVFRRYGSALLGCALGGSNGPLWPQINSFSYRVVGRKVLFELREHKPDEDAGIAPASGYANFWARCKAPKSINGTLQGAAGLVVSISLPPEINLII